MQCMDSDKQKNHGLVEKYHDVIPYTVFGVLTTLVNIVTYWLFAHFLHMPIMTSTVLSWVLSVLFAYVTNRKWVFRSDAAAARAILREFDGEAIMVVHAGGHVYAFGEAEYPLQISIREFEELPQDAIYGISMRLASEKAAEEAAARIKEKYGAEAAPYQNVRHVDVVAAGCSKGTGIDKVREIFGIGRFGGIGDSYNDLPLLEASDISFTFPDAPEELRNAADEIVLSVSDAIGKMR